MMLDDEPSGLRAFIGIHNTNLGPALGGTRMKVYDSEEAAVQDVLGLSRAMSYKCALANLPFGGGKAVIMANGAKDRDQVLAAYARLVEKLRGLFKTGTDVGISDADVVNMARHTEHMLGVVAGDRGELTTGKTAALGVFHAIRATLSFLYGESDFHGRSIAIKGIGKLGGELARLVSEAGGRVIVSDVDEAACARLKRQLPNADVVPNGQIHKQKVTIYAPCALGNEFTAESVAELQCEAVAGGANNQLANEKIGDELFKRHILYAPDYIANAGGLIYVADELEPGGFSRARVLSRTAAIENTMTAIFSEAKSQNKPTHRIADILALERIQMDSHA